MADTIYALASARGKAGVSVVRISGPEAEAVLGHLGCRPVKPRQASLRRLSDGIDLIDEAVVLLFPEGASFTGETVVELQVHGSVAVVSKLLQFLSGIAGLRQAEPGEFTRRALANGRLDLTQVEGLADLIEAETEAQRRQAQRVLDGAIGQKVEGWRKSLTRAAALIEATIDFADEDVPENVVPEVVDLLKELRNDFALETKGAIAAERIRDGFEVAILGAPNVGKSTLLNRLAGRSAAITSSVAGTTRDVIEVRMDIKGLPVTLLDTAGIRETADEIEKIGISRALDRAKNADLRVVLVEPGQEPPNVDIGADDLVVVAKADLAPEIGQISAATGAGVSWLIDQIAVRIEQRAAFAGDLTRERHRKAVENAAECLDSALKLLYEEPVNLELVAADLRAARVEMELLLGRIDVEALLDEIFSSFCIGK